MSITQKIAHNSASMLIGKAISTLLGFAAFLMMANYLGAEKFGWYSTVITFLGFAGILIDFGLIPLTAQMLSEPVKDEKRLFKNLFTFRLVTSVVFFALVPFVALLFDYPTPVKIAISFSTISFVGVSLNQVLVGFYQKQLRTHIQAIGEVIGRVVLVAGLYLMIAGHASFLYIMGLVLLSSLSYTSYLLMNAAKDGYLGFAFDKKVWKEIVVRMWPLAIAVIFNVVYLKGDMLLLSVFRSQAEVGVYGAAYRVVDIVAQMAMMVMGIMLPLITYHWSRKDTKGFLKRYQQSFDLMMVMAFPVCAGIFLTAGNITTLFGEELAVAAHPLRILSLAVFGVYLGAVFGHAIVAINKQKKALWVYLVNSIITFTGYLVFIPKFGYMAAAWMTVFSEFFTAIVLWIMMRRISKASLDFRPVSKVIASTAVMAIFVVLTSHMSIFVIAPIAALAYGVMLILTKAISSQTLKSILLRN